MADEKWKSTGKELGSAFRQFGKTFVKSARTVADKADEKINGDEAPAEQKTEDNGSNVFNDGSWRETGKGLGRAFKDLGKTIAGEFGAGSGNSGKSDDSGNSDNSGNK